MPIFDSHCHLQDERFDSMRNDVLERMQKHDVMGALCCGTRPKDWTAVENLTKENSCIIPAFGIHPWYADEATNGWDASLQDLLESEPKACVGEVGLDGVAQPKRMRKQQDVFVRQLRIAREFSRPVSVHCRQAWGALIDGLNEAGEMPDGFVLHSYSGSVELLPVLLKLGAFFSFSGAICNPNARRVAARVCAVPDERLLVETDAPDMLPYALKGISKINEPGNLPHVVCKVAEMRGVSKEEIAELTMENAQRVFGLEC